MNIKYGLIKKGQPPGNSTPTVSTAAAVLLEQYYFCLSTRSNNQCVNNSLGNCLLNYYYVAQRKRILSSAFKEELEEDEEEQDNSGWTGQSKSSRGGISAVNYQITATDPSKYLQGNEVVKSALEEDASVFDYDGNYDKFKTEKSNSYEKAPTQQVLCR